MSNFYPPLPMAHKRAVEIAGTLSTPGKMPGYGTSLPAALCQTGAKLAQVDGTVCQQCYAKRGNYTAPNVQAALHRRFAGLNHPDWEDAMVTLLIVHCLILPGKGQDSEAPYFRWFDSGDLQSLRHLEQIVHIAWRLPMINFWVPTREATILRAYLRAHGADWPPNLSIRYSLPKIGQIPTSKQVAAWRERGIGVSGVVGKKDIASAGGALCPSIPVHKPQFGSAGCGPCRRCWRPGETVVYLAH